jgi:hypothetical protein
MPESCRFPPHWSIEESSARCMGDKKALAYVYFRQRGRSAVGRKVAILRRGIPRRGKHCRAAKRAAPDIFRGRQNRPTAIIELFFA